ncbi:MAG TPA: mechanosensitive ion channel family protein [Streptosporangiaceae bacterium]|nr:mechanosensitive ion channel family protein [Streptosporangiaceae bacterium]
MTSQALALALSGISSSARPTLDTACAVKTPGGSPGIACRVVWDVTHSTHAAELTRVFLAGPVTLVLRILFVVVVAIVIRTAAHRMIRKIAGRAAEPPSGKPDASHLVFRERRRQRAHALGSVLGNAASVVIFGIAAVMIAGDLGLNLAPVLASAGVLGIAIGFGAQSLVRDFLAGIFMLMEDQYGVGDVIDAGDSAGIVAGTVEAVSLRVTRLRDVNGVVWHVRNGTIAKIGNESQGWSRAVIDFPVALDRNLPRVRQVMKETAAQIWQEPRWAQVILEEPEVWGVESVSSDAITMRLVAKTLPLQQWSVARELRERLKIALDDAAVPGEPVASALGAGAAATVEARAHAGQETR